MASDVQGAFVNYYEVLGVEENASPVEIQVALKTYRESLEARMNNPLSMGSARSAMNEIVPVIERVLLADDTTRREYERQLAASRRKQAALYEPDDDQGLDDALRIPFLFNPFEDFDTETPAYTLRLIAMKLDSEWPEAHRWIRDTSDETHGFISYLTFVANRKRLAERVGQILEAVSRTNGPPMDTNEGIERCISILDPHIERPRISIHNPTFDGRTLDAGTFISDLPARSELLLAHEGVRGCVFGAIESRTSWLTFDNGQSSTRFALMPEGTDPAIGASERKVPLIFKVDNLTRNASHAALLVLHVENQAKEVEQPIQVVIYIQPLPPRVAFEPEASSDAPAWAGIVRRGVPTGVMVTVRNHGDEGLIPLVAHISSNDQASRANPAQFRANQPIALQIDTSRRPYGQKYQIAYTINYLTAGAQGPATIHVQGEILPTSWQSMLREKGLGERTVLGCVAGFAGLLLLGGFGASLAAHANFAWLVFLAIPVLFALATRSIVSTIVAHRQRAGNPHAQLEQIAPWLLWGIPTATGLTISLICMLMPDTNSAFLIAGLIGLTLGFAFGFIVDKARQAKGEKQEGSR